MELDVNLELGGTDQTFNMLMGRQLQKEINNKEKFVLTLPLLLGTDGRKMSKSFGNSIDIDDIPIEMYGKIMSLKDELILSYFEACTDLTQTEINKLKTDLDKSNPIEIKKKLAFQITSFYHGEKAAQEAGNHFQKTVQDKELPDDIEVVKFSKSILPKPYLYFLNETSLVTSNSEAGRLAKQGGIEFDGKKIEDIRSDFETSKDAVIVRSGKRKFIRLEFV